MFNINQIAKEFEGQAKGLDFSKLKSLEPVVQLQRTEEWFAQRRFKFTSSSIHKILTAPKSAEAKKNGELGETAKTYILEKVTEEIGGELPEYTSAATQWGEVNEEEAKKAYTFKTGNSLEEVGFVKHTEFFGGSPDSTVLDHNVYEDHLGGLEVKCPYNSVNHTKHLLIADQKYFKEKHPDYFWQCQSHIITLDVQWCDFVSFDPRVKEGFRLFIFRVQRDEDDIILLKEALEKALVYKEKIKKQLGIC